jgi:hypothetical protein
LDPTYALGHQPPHTPTHTPPRPCRHLRTRVRTYVRTEVPTHPARRVRALRVRSPSCNRVYVRGCVRAWVTDVNGESMHPLRHHSIPTDDPTSACVQAGEPRQGLEPPPPGTTPESADAQTEAAGTAEQPTAQVNTATPQKSGTASPKNSGEKDKHPILTEIETSVRLHEMLGLNPLDRLDNNELLRRIAEIGLKTPVLPTPDGNSTCADTVIKRTARTDDTGQQTKDILQLKS